MNDFGLKPFENFNILKPTDPNTKIVNIVNIEIDKLKHYRNHPFQLYSGKRLDEMIESIRINGVMSPLIVRELDNGYYEILAGHNRCEASKIANLKTVPCIVKKDLTEDEAHFIVTETNLMQRSFSDLSHKERAEVIKMHYEVQKRQGRRKDLVEEVETIMSDEKLKNASENVSEEFALSSATIRRYLRIFELTDEFKNLLDEEDSKLKLPFVAGIALSFLKIDEQKLLYDFIKDNKISISVKNAEMLKKLSLNDKLTIKEIEKVFLGKEVQKSKESKKISINRKKINTYFPNKTDKEIEEEILKAIEFYIENNKEEVENVLQS